MAGSNVFLNELFAMEYLNFCKAGELPACASLEVLNILEAQKKRQTVNHVTVKTEGEPGRENEIDKFGYLTPNRSTRQTPHFLAIIRQDLFFRHLNFLVNGELSYSERHKDVLVTTAVNQKENNRADRSNTKTDKAQEAKTSDYKKICGTPSSYIYTLAHFWAQSSARNPNDFFDEVTDKVHMIYNTDEKSVAKKILSEEPFVFVIVSRKTYDSQKELFIQKGYELVTEETGSWYMNEMNRKIAAEEKKFKLDEKNSIPQIAEFTGKDEISDADKFYYANLEKLI